MIARRYVTGRCLVKRMSNTRGNRAIAQLLEQLDAAECTDRQPMVADQGSCGRTVD